MMLRVLYRNSKYDMVKDSFLDGLIISGRIEKFRRAQGWVTIGRDATRGRGGVYDGPERRRPVTGAL
jgi:hypothetical protein